MVLLNLGLTFLQGALALALHGNWPVSLINAFRSSIAELQKVKDDPVTRAELESFRG